MNTLLLRKIKINENPGPIPEVKKSALISDYENIAYSEESEQSEVYANKCGLLQIHLMEGKSEGQCYLRKIWVLLLSFKLGNNIPST